MSKINVLFNVIFDGLRALKITFFSNRKDRYGFLSSTAKIQGPVWGPKGNVYIHDYCGINSGAKFICQVGKFILHKNCSIGPNFTVITFNHSYNTYEQRPESINWGNLNGDNVIVNEDVWIGANVTLCPGTTIGRGSVVAAGSVCIKNKLYPPYSIIGGNPAKFLKFRLSLEDQICHEQLFYAEEEQIDSEVLKENYLIMTRKINE